MDATCSPCANGCSDEHGILTTACSVARAPLEMTRPSLRISPHVDLAPEHVVALRTALATA